VGSRALTLYHVRSENIGYGRLGVNLRKALDDLGVDCFDDMPVPGGLHWPHEDQDVRRPGLTNVVAWVSTPTHARGWWKGQYPVIFSMWEATRLPESLRQILDNFALVVVPSNQNAELFGRYHPNVVMVPLGIDPEVWHYEPRVPHRDDFRFMIAGSGPRKGVDLVYKAFRTLWPTEGSWGSGPVPTLVMKNPRRENYGGPRIEIVGGKIPAEQEVDLYGTAHCYLQPSRGEGFGLQPLQALAQGIPTILTAAHGHDSFAHLGLGISASLVKSAYFIYGEAGDWWEPEFDELCDQMRWVYENYDVALAQAAAASQVVASEFTWAQTAQGFVDAIGPERLEVAFPRTTEWVAPEQRQYLVIVNKDMICDIGGVRYHFERGKEYHEVADVKRVLFEAERLDPACLDPNGDDLGLVPQQLAQLGDYSARHGYCPTCRQRLESKPTLTDDIEAQLNAKAGVP
jgi:glycosyltransferase involved in cell wall biosynthesis